MDDGSHDGENPKGQSKIKYRYVKPMPEGHFLQGIPVL